VLVVVRAVLPYIVHRANTHRPTNGACSFLEHANSSCFAMLWHFCGPGITFSLNLTRNEPTTRAAAGQLRKTKKKRSFIAPTQTKRQKKTAKNGNETKTIKYSCTNICTRVLSTCQPKINQANAAGQVTCGRLLSLEFHVKHVRMTPKISLACHLSP